MQNQNKKQNIFIKARAIAGFTFIELIVVVAIMLIITSVALFRQAKFSSDILITDMAYEVALAIRQAEVLGISSKGTIGADPYRVGYGVHFDSALATAIPSSYVNFLDQPENTFNLEVGNDTTFLYQYRNVTSEYPNGVSPDFVEFTQGQKISGFCGHVSGGDWQCFWRDGRLGSTDMALNIVFVKPNPEAHITVGVPSGSSFTYNTTSYDKAKIIVESTLGDKCRTITVSVSGQIGVDALDPSDLTYGCGE